MEEKSVIVIIQKRNWHFFEIRNMSVFPGKCFFLVCLLFVNDCCN